MNRKSSAEIEREIHLTRAEMGRTLDSLQERLSPRNLVSQMLGSGPGMPGAMAQGVGQIFRDYPIPATLIGAGLWMLVSGRSTGTVTVVRPSGPANEEAGESLMAKAKGAVSTLKDKAGAQVDKVADEVRGLGQQASATAAELQEKMAEKADALQRRVAGAAAHNELRAAGFLACKRRGRTQ